MGLKEIRIESLIVLISSLVLALTISFKNNSVLNYAFISFLIILSVNILTKKIVGNLLETNVKTKFWSIYQWGFRKDSHFKTKLPMVWLPLIITLFTKGIFWWLAVLEFDVEAKTERVSRKHGLYRFTQVTEWHIAWIAIWGIIANLSLAIIGYLAGFELFAKLNIYFAMWSIIPLSNLDGSKIFFASRGLWMTLFTILLVFFGWSFIIS
tara:strand:+ start:97 stop:726 length:630 start_codon:yes stop_codon:yes gene_type:complete